MMGMVCLVTREGLKCMDVQFELSLAVTREVLLIRVAPQEDGGTP